MSQSTILALAGMICATYIISTFIRAAANSAKGRWDRSPLGCLRGDEHLDLPEPEWGFRGDENGIEP